MLPRFAELAAGAFSSCGLLEDGRVVCWGMTCTTPNPQRRDPLECFGRGCTFDGAGDVECTSFGGADGQLPVDPVSDGREGGPYRSVAVTLDFGCGLRADGQLVCWGVPLITEDGNHYASFSLGFCMGCGLRDDGSVGCPHACRKPVFPPTGSFVDVSAGDRHACAVRTSGEVACWGAGEQTRITAPGGNNDCPSFPQSCGQAAPPSGARFVDVEAGRFHSCALDDAGEVHCWGLGTRDDGCDLGTFECGQSMPPTGPFTALAAGAAHTCGIRMDGTLECWGAGVVRRDCRGDTQAGMLHCGQSMPPAGRFVQVAAGHWHTCALDTGGQIQCWGLGDERGACFDSSVDVRFDFECGQSIPPRL